MTIFVMVIFFKVSWMESFFSAPDSQFIRLIFERSLALLYFIAFLSAFNQFPALLGEGGLLPVPQFLKHIKFKSAPSLFHWKYSDRLFRSLCMLSMVLCLLLVLGISAYLPILVHILLWLTLYGLYLSIVNVGQDFYGFGWETMLLEAGFFMAFMGPEWVTPSWIPIVILLWMLFRTEMGAGLIKLRGDPCWRDLTCLYYHHETQPLPNPLSRFFHHGPKLFHRSGVMFSHFVQLIIPFGIFLPQPIAAVCGGLIILHQLILVISGNYSWLNWLTIVLGILCFSDFTAGESLATRPLWFEGLQWGVGILAIGLSVKPFQNLFSKQQKMNFCWNRFHLVGAYGAFGSVTKKRYEIIIEGSQSNELLDPGIVWQEYEFKGKPGNLKSLPPVVAPYHLRLDWMIWFLPFTVGVGSGGINVWGYGPWFLRFIQKLLSQDEAILDLIKINPFCKNPPQLIRALFYHYEFTSKEEFKERGEVWKRTLIDEYLPPVSLNDLLRILKS